MKKKLLGLLSFILIFSSCNNDLANIDEKSVANTEILPFSGIVSIPQTKGIVQQKKLWDFGTEITIGFLNGTESQKNKVKEYSKEWLNYAGISFKYVDNNEDANVRIGFDYDSKMVTWSYTGKDCLSEKNQNKPTMNFAKFHLLNDILIKGYVLRAFGQMLGLELENRHLNFNPKWMNEEFVKKYWEISIPDIEWTNIKKYVFDPIDNSNDVIKTDTYDLNSIMMWPFYPPFVLNPVKENYTLSEKDIKFIKTIYPKN